MNGKKNDPRLDVHLDPIERELDCALHRPLHESEQSYLFRGETDPTYFSSSFSHLPFPRVTPPMGPFPKQGMNVCCTLSCLHSLVWTNTSLRTIKHHSVLPVHGSQVVCPTMWTNLFSKRAHTHPIPCTAKITHTH